MDTTQSGASGRKLGERMGAMAPGHGSRRSLALLVENLGIGGVQQVFINLANGFSDCGYDVKLISLSGENALEAQIAGTVDLVVLKKGGVLLGLARSILRDRSFLSWFFCKRFRKAFQWLESMRSLIERDAFDFVISADMRTNSVAVMATAMANNDAKVVVGLSSYCIRGMRARASANSMSRGGAVAGREQTVPEAPWPATQSLQCLTRAAAITAVSRGLADSIAGLIGCSRTVYPIHNPIVSQRLRQHWSSGPPHVWLSDPDVPVILGVGRLTPVKGFDVLLRACALVRQKRPVRLMIVGFNPEASGQRRLRQELLALAARLGMPDDLAILPTTDSPYPYFEYADVFALSSWAEGFGNVLVEALFFGLPVVSTDCPSGPSEILGEGAWGTLVPMGDHQAMANALCAALDGKRALDPNTLRARAEHFSIEQAVAAYARVFDDVG